VRLSGLMASRVTIRAEMIFMNGRSLLSWAAVGQGYDNLL
jgi:hypothetical protein